MDSRPVYLGIPGIHKMEGRVIGIANFKVKAGMGDKAAEILATIKKRADSDEEPDCFHYHVIRNGFDPDQITVFEGYNLPDGPTGHIALPPFVELITSGILVGWDVHFYDEIPAAP